MARSIKEVGEKLEGEVKKEVVKKESDVLKDIVKSLPSDVRVRVMKVEDGTRVYVATVPIEDYDKSDPFAWLKRRFANKHGSGEYVIEFISPDGEVLKTAGPITIKLEEDTGKEAEYIKKAKEALKLKEEAIEKRAELAEKLSQLESERANLLVELVSKQIDMMSKFYEDRINFIMEQLEKGGGQDNQLLLMELQRLKEDYKNAVDRLYELVQRATTEKEPEYLNLLVNVLGKLVEQTKDTKEPEYFSVLVNLLTKFMDQMNSKKEPEYFTLLANMINKSLEKDATKETLGLINLVKEVLKPVEDKKEEKKGFLDELLENPQKAELFKKILGIEEKKDIITELAENPQKLELIKKLFGLDEVREIKSSISEIARMREHEPPERKDVIAEVIEYGEKLKKLKDVLGPVLGVQSQPVKSFLELVATILQSPHISEIVSRVMEGFTKAKLIEQGFIPVEYAGQIVPVRRRALPSQQAQAQAQTSQAQAQETARRRRRMKKEEVDMVKEVLIAAIHAAAQEMSEKSTPEDFAVKIADFLYVRGKNDPTFVGLALSMSKRRREELARETLKEAVPDMPDDMVDFVVKRAEERIRELVARELMEEEKVEEKASET